MTDSGAVDTLPLLHLGDIIDAACIRRKARAANMRGLFRRGFAEDVGRMFEQLSLRHRQRRRFGARRSCSTVTANGFDSPAILNGIDWCADVAEGAARAWLASCQRAEALALMLDAALG